MLHVSMRTHADLIRLMLFLCFFGIGRDIFGLPLLLLRLVELWDVGILCAK